MPVRKGDKQRTYIVLVGNIGTVHNGRNKAAALQVFGDYKRQSKSGLGRAAGEAVMVYADGADMELVAEYAPAITSRVLSAQERAKLELEVRNKLIELLFYSNGAPAALGESIIDNGFPGVKKATDKQLIQAAQKYGVALADVIEV